MAAKTKQRLNQLTQFFKSNWKQLLLIVVLFGLLVVFCLDSHFIRLGIAIRSLWRSLIYYFKSIFKDNADVVIAKPDVSYDYMLAKAGGSIFDLIPIDFGKLGHHLTMMFNLLINSTFWHEWFIDFSKTLSIVVFINNILLYLVLFVLLFTAFRHFKPNSLAQDTKALSRYKTLRNKVKPKALKVLYMIKSYFKKWLIIALVILACFYFQLFTIATDIIANYYYFLAEFDLSIIWKGLLINVLDFAPVFQTIPLVIRVLLLYWLFDKIRIRKAVDGIKDKEQKMVDFLESSGNEILINGGSRAGKNALAVTMAVCYVQILFPKMILNSILDIQRKFPFVNYAKLRDYVEEKKELRYFKNQRDIYYDMMKRNKDYKLTKDKSLYFIDDASQSLNKWDELTNESVAQALADYMILYFIYITEKPRSVSNYTIMFNSMLNEKNHYLNVNHLDPIDETVHDYNKRQYNVVINYDFLRLGHRFSSYKPEEYYVPDVGLYTITEIGKERGDTDSVKKTDGTANNVNQKNDKFTERLKIWSHDATIRFQTLFKLIGDEQRNVGLNANTRSTFETIILLDKRKMKKKSALKMWKLEEYLCRLILSKYDAYSLKRDEIKQELSLPNYLLKKFIEKLNMYYYRRYNKFTYTECNVYAQNGTVEGVNDDVEAKKVFIINKLSYSGRYETASLKKLFLDDMKNSKLAFDDRVQFESLTPSPDNWANMRSFSGQDLFGFKYDK